MRTMIAITALTLISSLAVAEEFTYERQWASEDLASETSTLSFRDTDPASSGNGFLTTLETAFRDNPDVQILPPGYREPHRSAQARFCINSGYELLARDNPDMTGNC